MSPYQLRHILAEAFEGAAERLQAGLGSDAEPPVKISSAPADQRPLPEVTAHVLNVEDVAALLGISRWRAYESLRAGEIPSLRVGRPLLVPTHALRTWLISVGAVDRHSE
jgi:excisionase family DNA binding protein